jgi:hypothetical protein
MSQQPAGAPVLVVGCQHAQKEPQSSDKKELHVSPHQAPLPPTPAEWGLHVGQPQLEEH